MAAYSFDNSDFSSGNCFSGFYDHLGSCNIGSSHGRAVLSAVPVSLSQPLVLDSEKGELVKAPSSKVGKKSASEEKVMAALKSHSEAERRRRKRINSHLDTLRTLLPCNEKMDKATLLGEVIRQVKELKKIATEATKGFLVPMDDDEVRVEPFDDDDGDKANGSFSIKASICCDYRPQLLTDLRQALDAIPNANIKMVKAEISTLGGRLKNEFVFTGCTSTAADHVDDADQVRRFLACSIQQAMNSVLEKAYSSPEYSPCSTLLFRNKRRRISYLDASTTSL